ncbi:MAG: hypothetical protein PHR16_13570 [Methylovulum sp.]|nr:hypothetical protein [Methylovulum sp.]
MTNNVLIPHFSNQQGHSNKAGLAAMTKVLAEGRAIRSGSIVQQVALKRSGAPSDIAKAVLFLIKDAGLCDRTNYHR